MPCIMTDISMNIRELNIVNAYLQPICIRAEVVINIAYLLKYL